MSDEINDPVLIDFLKEKTKREDEERINREEEQREEREEEIEWIMSHNRSKEDIIAENPFVLMLEYIERVQLAERMMQRRIKLFNSLHKANLMVLGFIALLTCLNFIFFIVGT